MSYIYASFAAAEASGLTGFTESTTNSSQTFGFKTSGSGTAKTTSTSTGIALPTTQTPSTGNQFAQLKIITASPSSVGVFLRGTRVGTGKTVTVSGYYVQVTSTAVSILKYDANGSNAVTVGTAVNRTSATGDILRATVSGSTIEVFVNNLSTPIISTTDTTYTGGNVGFKAGGVTTEIDDFYGGDLSDIGVVGSATDNTGATGSGGTGGSTGPVLDVIPSAPTATGLNQWRGLIKTPSGLLLSRGLPSTQLYHAFIGASGAQTLPDWLSVPEGTFSLTAPATNLPRLILDTAATAGAKATLQTTQAIQLSKYTRIELTINSFQFAGSASPAATFRMGAIGNAGIIQNATDEYVNLNSGGETKRTTGGVSYSILAPSATQRRSLTVIILPQDQEVFFVQNNVVRLYHDARKWTPTAWTDAAVNIGVQVEATAAAVAGARVGDISLTLWS